MSSKGKRVSKEVVERRITTVVQVLAIMEEEAHKKNFFERFVICMQYLFCKKFDAFFKTGKRKNKNKNKEN